MSEDNYYIAFKEGKGKTIFAKKKFKKGDLIFIIAGPIVSLPSIFTVPISDNLFIDPVEYNHPAKYLCHDCNPTAGIQSRTKLVAFKDIKIDDEISIDYAMVVRDYSQEMTDENIICHCGYKNCRGKLGSYSDLSQNLKKKYSGFISSYLIKSGNTK